MGLCKCPKKRVTNQFCFDHRVNVCEHCLVSNHSKCIVQSYLNWLQDSDYEPICQLCKRELAMDDCIRLLCYHVFHWTCIDELARSLPPQTAPAGYTCPVCKKGIFPTSNILSPVADALKHTLSTRASWARHGLGIVGDTTDLTVEFSDNPGPSTMSLPHNNHVVAVESYSGTSQTRIEHSNTFPKTPAFNPTTFTNTRKIFDSTSNQEILPFTSQSPFIDHDDNKYKRRSAIEWISRWFKSHGPAIGRSQIRAPQLIYKRYVILAILAILGLVTLVLVFLSLGRSSADNNPLLDPLMNPNIRIADDTHKNSID